MFKNEFASIAYNVYNGKRVHVIGRNALGKIRDDFGFDGTAVVCSRNQGPFGGMQYFIYVAPDESFNESNDPREWSSAVTLYVNTADDLDKVAKRITLL